MSGRPAGSESAGRGVAALAALCLAVCFAGFATAEEAPWTAWRSRLHAESPLIGVHALQAAGATRITPERLADALAGADHLLLGETHDNPDHHRLQAWILERLAARGRRIVAAFEMIDAGQEPALRAYLSSNGATAEGLGVAIGWEAHGWPAWAMYAPVAEAAMAAWRKDRWRDAPPILSAGGPARETVRTVGRGGFDAALSRADQERLGLTTPLPEPLSDDLREELFNEHCRLMPREAMEPLLNIQRLRDAAFADRLLKAREDDGGPLTAVLIAGGGHVRRDRGAPWSLAMRDPAARIAVVLFVEADAETTSLDGPRFFSPQGTPTADFVWVTPAAGREDPCEKLRQHMKRKETPPVKGR